MNSDRFHVFYEDAHHQLIAIPTWIHEPERIERGRRPLILVAIAHMFSVNQIRHILDRYEGFCRASQIDPHAFLNSTFPDNRPADLPPLSPRSRNRMRSVFSFHVAVLFRRRDIVKY